MTMHKNLTDPVIKKHLNQHGIIRDGILTGSGVYLYTAPAFSIPHQQPG
jgi:hypothetical protein